MQAHDPPPTSAASGPATPSESMHSYARMMRDSRLPRAEARRLMARVSGRSLTWLIAHEDETPTADGARAFERLAARRLAGEPLAYLLGEQEFFGRSFGVSPEVLIPRADTETLIEVALECLKTAPGPFTAPAPLTAAGVLTAPALPTTPDASVNADPHSVAGAPRLLDLGTGSGIIAITLALEVPTAEVHAVERSPGALALARQNAQRLGARIHWHLGSWWDALAAGDARDSGLNSGKAPDTGSAGNAGGTPDTEGTHRPHEAGGRPARFDLIVSNPPYIAAGDAHLGQGDLRFEPPQALAAGADGLDDLRIIIDGAQDWLSDGGWLLLEHGYDQQAAVQSLLAAAGFGAVFTRRDLAGQPRVSGGRKMAL